MLTRFDPFREMLNLRNNLDRLVDGDTSLWDWEPLRGELALDVKETDDEYLVEASIPGINPDDLDITYNNRVLTIQGEKKEEKEEKETHYHLRERRFGRFSRTITLPMSVDADNIEAEYDKGVLMLHLPKVEEAKPKRISVHAGEHKRLKG
jgi:HSP20 family protein